MNPFSATVLIVGSDGLEASVHSWITYLSLESWPGLYSRQLAPLVHVVDVVRVGEGVAPDDHLRRRLLQRLGCGFQGGLRPGIVSVFLCFALFVPFSVPPGEEVVPEVHEVLLLVALALSLQTYFTMVDKFQEKSQLSEIVKDRPKIPATKLGCSVSSSNSQGEPLQQQKQNGDS